MLRTLQPIDPVDPRIERRFIIPILLEAGRLESRKAHGNRNFPGIPAFRLPSHIVAAKVWLNQLLTLVVSPS
jgi:hypothetical protein